MRRQTLMQIFLVTCLTWLGGSAAHAAWPDHYENRVALMEALQYDLAMPGVTYDAKEVASRYKKSCDMELAIACVYERWQGPQGGDLAMAREYFKRICGGEPLGCVVVGWSYSRTPEGYIDRNAASAGQAMTYFQKACEKAYGPGCTGMGELYLDGVGVPRNTDLARKYLTEGCEARDYWACNRLAEMYAAGVGVSQDGQKAAGLYGTACDRGIPHACVELGKLKERGVGVPQDGQGAARIYGDACKAKFGGGCAELGRLYASGRFVKRSTAVAQSLLQPACDGGALSACFQIAQMWEEEGEEGSLQKAYGVYDRACRQGMPEACTRLGRMYLLGRGVPRDVGTGLNFMDEACAANSAEACDELGVAFESGKGLKMNLTKAVENYKKACELGGGSGCYHLGKLHEVGKGTDQDPRQARALLLKACDNNYGPGCGELGVALVTGVSAKPELAAQMFEKACGLGDGGSCARLGAMYARGEGIPGDSARAFALLKDGCFYGSAAGCHVLGTLYEKGDGTTQDFSAALESYERACELGSDDGCKAAKPVMFQAQFERIVRTGTTSNICQVFSIDPEVPERNVLVAEVNGTSFRMADGPHSGATLEFRHVANEFGTGGGKLFGKSNWTARGGTSELVVAHLEEVDTDEVDSFPLDQSFSLDRKGESRLAFSREDESVKRLGNSKCKFQSGYPELTTEHCGDLQALLAAQAATVCKGE